jgi:hypothetical protein
MTGLDLSPNLTEDLESLVRRARTHFGSFQLVRTEVDPASFVPSTSTPKANQEKTLCEYSTSAANQVPSSPEINTGNENFEIKIGLIMMV